MQNVIYANGAYTYRKLVYENTRAQVYTIMAKVEDLPGYVEGETPVVFSGEDVYKSQVFLPQEQNLGFAAVTNVGMRRALADGCDLSLIHI